MSAPAKTPRRGHRQSHKAVVPDTASFDLNNVESKHSGAVELASDMFGVFKELGEPEQSADFDKRFSDTITRYDRLPQ